MFEQIGGWLIFGYIISGGFVLLFVIKLDPDCKSYVCENWFDQLMVWPYVLFAVLKYGPQRKH